MRLGPGFDSLPITVARPRYDRRALAAGGWIEQISDTGALFRVRAQDAEGVVCEATVRLEIGAPAPAHAVTARVVLPVAAMPACC